MNILGARRPVRLSLAEGQCSVPLGNGPQGVWNELVNTPAAKNAASPLEKGGQVEELQVAGGLPEIRSHVSMSNRRPNILHAFTLHLRKNSL